MIGALSPKLENVGGNSTVEREIARVATACDLRAFRYIPYASIKFDPFPISEIARESATPAANSEVESCELAQPMTPSPAFVSDLVPVSVVPMPAVRTAHPGLPLAVAQVSVAPSGTPGSPRDTPRRAWPKQRQQT